ncbi:MAG TPA: DUF2867 domain-containing protein [Cytophagales bacterium]|jgi:uncharacterized protein YbjT (DUF2867 family)|nr:DUF2867 domain-containing protein [Cytophagales bacterium]
MNILITGATGYIGRRLLNVLLQRDIQLYGLIRDKKRLGEEWLNQTTIKWIEGDLLKPDQLPELPSKIDVAFYLVHSMGASFKEFETLEEKAAKNFCLWVDKTKVNQIIYLSGIVNDDSLSRHLQSRKNVEEILRSSGINTTILRAAIIIGSGGASFEITRDLVEKLPVMIAPRWIDTLCQPIAIRNVIDYLTGVMLQEDSYNRIFDIGGPDVLTYKDMMLQFAEVRGLRRWIIKVPVLTPNLSSLWLFFVTSTSFNLARSLVESMNIEVTVKNKGIEEIVPVDLIPYKDSIRLAFDKIKQNEVISSWKDAISGGDISPKMSKYVELPKFGCLHDSRKVSIHGKVEEAIDRIWSIGGESGWYYGNWLWQIRGFMDQMVGGIGLRRGRRSPSDLKPGDALDFWRVLFADKNEGRLLLYAEMKLPGEAWLEFKIDHSQQQAVLIQTATFRPNGLLGRLYWYLILPFHELIFRKLAQVLANGPKG